MDPGESPSKKAEQTRSRERKSRVSGPRQAGSAAQLSNPVADDGHESPTRVDRIRRRVSNNPIGSVLILLFAALAAVGAAAGGVQSVVGLFDAKPDSHVSPSESASPSSSSVELGAADLKLAKNYRYGFTINYPAAWNRNDPTNQDGISAEGPEAGMRIAAYGALADDRPTLTQLDAMAEGWTTEPGTHVLEGPSSQNVSWRDINGTMSELPGVRLVLDQLATNDQPAVTTVMLLTVARGRSVTALCQVVADQADRWRGACNQLTSSLTILGVWSQ